MCISGGEGPGDGVVDVVGGIGDEGGSAGEVGYGGRSWLGTGLV